MQKVDEEKRQIWFSAGGMNAGQDPYFLHYYRINFDGTGLTRLTTVAADHQVSVLDRHAVFRRHLFARRSRTGRRASPDAAICRWWRSSNGRTSRALTKAGWKAPEVFVAKGRDGATDIWGLIFRPSNFDASRRSTRSSRTSTPGRTARTCRRSSARSTPRRRRPSSGSSSCRSTAWARRIARRRFTTWRGRTSATPASPIASCGTSAAAAKYPWYDITRVGIYGGSAGGQNSMGALLFHPEFYKVAVSYAGCHDNRMDKIWWNEQWMGWPLGPQYSASSNVDHAAKLQGKLLLVVGELDTNVDPASTHAGRVTR